MLAVLAGCAGTKSHDSKNLTTNSQGRYIARDTSRTVDLTNPPSDAWDRIRRGFAIPNLNTELSQQWTDYYASHPESVQRMAERAGKYLYFIVDEINRRGLPTELALLPFVESAYNPTALSRAQASGLWFVPATGQHFNLKQDWWRDERRDPIASTNAALDYRKSCSKCRATGTGAGLVQLGRRLRATRHGQERGRRPAHRLPVPVHAGRDPQLRPQAAGHQEHHRRPAALRGGAAAGRQHALLRDGAQEQRHRPEIAAKLAEMPLDEFKALNPSFNRPVIRGDHAPTLLLPADRVEIFNANLTNYKGDLSAWKVYHSRRGESYASIAKRFGVSEAKLRETNDIGSRQKVAAGQSMLVPGDPGPGGIQVASLAPPSARWIPRRQAAARPRHMAARRRRLRPASPAPAPTSAPTRSGRATPCSRWPSSTAPRSTLRALNNLKGNALKVGGQLRVPGTNARGRGPRALRASQGPAADRQSRLRAALIWRGPGLVWLVGREACH